MKSSSLRSLKPIIAARASHKNKLVDPHLSSRFAAAVLPPLLEAGVPVRPDDAVVQPRAVDEAHGVLGPCARVVPGHGGG